MCVRECECVCSVFVGACEHACVRVCVYSATREDDTTFIFSHFGLFLSDAASNSHK